MALAQSGKCNTITASPINYSDIIIHLLLNITGFFVCLFFKKPNKQTTHLLQKSFVHLSQLTCWNDWNCILILEKSEKLQIHCKPRTVSSELSFLTYSMQDESCIFFFFCLYNTVSNDIHLRTVTAQGITLDYSTNCLLFSHWENFWLNVLPKITVFIN